MRPPSPSIPEKQFLLEALSQSLRLDGRSFLEQRPPKLLFGPELGWAECALGKTRVLAQVSAKIVKPPPERPFEGVLTIHSELSPMASSEYEPGRATEEEVTIIRMLDKVLRRSDAVDKESLCILAGQRVWHIRVTVHCLADAGNMLDCACLAGIVALKHFRRPDVEVIGDEVIIHDPTERAPIPLSINHTPYCLTFAFFPRPNPHPSTAQTPIIILDPTPLETTLSSGLLSLSLNAQKELCVLQKFGGLPLGVDDVMEVVRLGVERVVWLDGEVERMLKGDWEERKGLVEGR